MLQKLLISLLLITNLVSANSVESLLVRIGYSKIPLQKINGALYAQGTVQDKQVYFLIDSGSTSTSIRSDGLEVLGLVSQDTDQKVANMTGGVSYAQKVTLEEVMLGSLCAGVLEAKVMQQPFKHDKPTLVIGNDIFERYYAILDVGNQILYLNSNIVSRKELFEIEQCIMEQLFHKIPLSRLWSGHLTMPVQINSALPIPFLCDTGTSHTTLSDAYVHAFHIPYMSAPQTSEATDGTITYAQVSLDTITLNPLQLFYREPIIISGAASYAANIESMSQFLGVVGILGLAHLEQCKSIICFPMQTLYCNE